ncbi:MAG: RNA 2',3'-cyclic phosphodiesterase [Armatimonadota bacterium]|nr:MAG: RNA 2',3'-cyclic phosphodiesterase [Armatimonadota bacterium]
MRAFVAVNLDGNLRQAIGEAQGSLRRTGGDVKWVRPDNMHLTLKFLGWVDDARLAPIVEAVRPAVEAEAPFRLRIEGTGGFPSATAPRVIWVGVKEGAEELARLAERVEAALEPLGFDREARGFSPHVTVGRCRSAGGRDGLAAEIRAMRERPFGEMEVRRVELMRSDLRPTGPIYTSQHAFDLAGAPTEQGEG